MLQTLSHLRALQAFDEVAKHASLTKAADVLNVTHGAISRQIKILEQYVGMPLFHRRPTGMEMTQAGERLYHSTAQAFAVLKHGVGDVKRLQQRPSINVSLSTSLALKWLVPELPAFQKDHPGISLRLDTNDALVDFDASDVDVALRFGIPPWPNLYYEKVVAEELIVVAAPDLVGDAALPLSTEAISNLPLLHDGFHDGWAAWAKQVGLDPEKIGTQNAKYVDSAVLLEAAIDRQGVALTRHFLAARDLKLGRLVRLDQSAVPLDRSLYFVCRHEDQDRKAVKQFKAWLLSA